MDLVDEDLLEQQYPEHRGHLGGSVIDVKQYIYDDTVDITGKSVVVDWYYKTTSPWPDAAALCEIRRRHPAVCQ